MGKQTGPRSSDKSAFVLPAVRDPRIRLFYEYWLSKCPADRIPGRQHIDPLEMGPFLEYVTLFDVERHPGYYRFRYRLVGTHVVELFGDDATGRYLDETNAPERYPATYARFSTIVDTGRPVYGILPIPWPNRDFVEFEHLTVPLATDGATIDILFGIRCGYSGLDVPLISQSGLGRRGSRPISEQS